MEHFYEDLRKLRQKFISDVSDLCVFYGMELIPLSFDEVFDFLYLPLCRVIDKDFRRKLERKIKSLRKKELNPLWRTIRGWFNK